MHAATDRRNRQGRREWAWTIVRVLDQEGLVIITHEDRHAP
jgi:hypothetical protein